MNIALYGSTLESYVAATSLCSMGHAVKLFTVDSDLTADDYQLIENEPELKKLVDKNTEGKMLTVGNGVSPIDAELHWVFFKGDSLLKLENLLFKICENNNGVNLVLSSSLGIGSYHSILQKLSSKYDDFNLATIPPFIREGSAIKDFESPELLLIGTEDNQLISKISTALSSVIESASKVMFVSGTEAEFIKTSICSVLATRISLINEISGLAEDLEIDINTVIDGMGADSRIGAEYLQPGCGFGGVTLSQEVHNLLDVLSYSSSGSAMLQAVVETNQKQKEVLFRKFWQYNKANISGLRVAIWGGSFKPNSSSTINSPIHELIDVLTAQSCEISIYDPAALDSLSNDYGGFDNISLCGSKIEAVRNSDALFIITAWKEFLEPNFLELKRLMKSPVIFDGRNIYEPGEVEAFGFEYFAIGRGKVMKRDCN